MSEIISGMGYLIGVDIVCWSFRLSLLVTRAQKIWVLLIVNAIPLPTNHSNNSNNHNPKSNLDHLARLDGFI